MAPTNKGQRRLALPALPSYLYILIPLSLLISIALIKRFNKSRLPASGNIKHKAFAPIFSGKPITTDNADENSIAQCTTGTMLPGHQAQQPGVKACISSDQASKMQSPAKTATRSASLPDVQVQSWHQLSNHKPILPTPPSPFPPHLPRPKSEDSQAPLQLPPPAPHWQPEETARLVDDIPSTHTHPFGSPVMQKQPVDFPQFQREAVQFFPRAGPDKRQAWRRRVLECN
ncbi:hypothetical protein EMCG_06379 [[Emmonsia] crescens]|uniref:Uncharacterized protein n=1 Tax=[Emmonsia] crescens TaxID=73230 RepID=A0A0G2IBC2_9EURO|nr:hypothetical protein EMCG_06379 [Emmonsia crescens UAMH 3008]